MTKVIKKNKKTEPFSAAKVKKAVEAAARQSKIPKKRAMEVARKVTKVVTTMARRRKEIKSRTIRNKIVKELDKREPAVAKAWRKYEKRKK